MIVQRFSASHHEPTSSAALDKQPTALLLAASGFAAGKGYGVVWGGVDRDEALSGQLHRLDRSCAK